MFGTLLESRRTAQRNIGSTLMSAAFHVLIVVGTVYATAKATEPEEEPEETFTYTTVKPNDPPPPKQPDAPQPPDATLLPPKGFLTLTAPIVIPTIIPEIKLGDPVTNASDFIPKGVRNGDPNGVDRKARTDSSESYFEFEVEKVARLAPGNPEPVYPSIMKQTRQSGKVTISFVIDTTGKADMATLEIVESTSSLFTDEVKKVLSKYKFIPADIGGRKVRMRARMPFVFTLDAKGGG